MAGIKASNMPDFAIEKIPCPVDVCKGRSDVYKCCLCGDLNAEVSWKRVHLLGECTASPFINAEIVRSTQPSKLSLDKLFVEGGKCTLCKMKLPMPSIYLPHVKKCIAKYIPAPSNQIDYNKMSGLNSKLTKIRTGAGEYGLNRKCLVCRSDQYECRTCQKISSYPICRDCDAVKRKLVQEMIKNKMYVETKNHMIGDACGVCNRRWCRSQGFHAELDPNNITISIKDYGGVGNKAFGLCIYCKSAVPKYGECGCEDIKKYF